MPTFVDYCRSLRVATSISRFRSQPLMGDFGPVRGPFGVLYNIQTAGVGGGHAVMFIVIYV
jgi:hypothetical protein